MNIVSLLIDSLNQYDLVPTLLLFFMFQRQLVDSIKTSGFK